MVNCCGEPMHQTEEGDVWVCGKCGYELIPIFPEEKASQLAEERAEEEYHERRYAEKMKEAV